MYFQVYEVRLFIFRYMKMYFQVYEVRLFIFRYMKIRECIYRYMKLGNVFSGI